MSADRVVVRRRLLHWRPRWRGPRIDVVDPDVEMGGGGGGGFSFLDFLDDLFAAVLVIVAVAVFVMAVVPAVVLVLEVLLVGLVAAIGFLGRAMLGRPWTVEARDMTTGEVLGAWEVQGFRRAGVVAAAIQERADADGDLPAASELDVLLAAPDDPAWPTG